MDSAPRKACYMENRDMFVMFTSLNVTGAKFSCNLYRMRDNLQEKWSRAIVTESCTRYKPATQEKTDQILPFALTLIYYQYTHNMISLPNILTFFTCILYTRKGLGRGGALLFINFML